MTVDRPRFSRVLLNVRGPWYRFHVGGQADERDGRKPQGAPTTSAEPIDLDVGRPTAGGCLNVKHLSTQDGISLCVLYRGEALMAELDPSRAHTMESVLEAVYWNDAILFSVDAGRGVVRVYANRCCSLPAMWTGSPNGVTVSNRVVPDLSTSVGPADVDPVGWAEALVFDAPLRERTVLRAVRQVPAGHVLQIERGKASVTRYRSLRLSGERAGPEALLVDEAVDLQRTAVARTVAPAGPISLPISGGLDSRGIAAFLSHEQRERARSVSFGAPGSLELRFGGAIAERLGLPWDHHVLDRRHYLDVVGWDLGEAGGGMSHAMHAHVLAAVAKLPDAGNSQVLIGFMGDPAAGAECGHEPPVRDAASSLHRLLVEHGYTAADLERCFSHEVAAAILGDLESMRDECIVANTEGELAEYYFCVERQAKLITHVFSAISLTGDLPGYPYLDGGWGRFYHSLGASYRKDRRIQRLAIDSGAPALNGIGDTCRTRGWLRVRRRLRRRLQSAVEVASAGRMTIPNPHQTENLPAVVNQILRPALLSSLGHLRSNGLIGADLSVRLARRRYSARGIHGVFRVLSLSHIMISALPEPRAPRGQD